MEKKRGGFSSNLGFILAAIGGAVGMGNLWRFPMYVGKYGGAIFLFVYIAIAAIFGMPLVLAEISIGRSAQMDAVKSFKVIAQREGSNKPKLWGILGFLTILTAMSCFAYYNVVGGWVIQYIVKSITMPLETMDMDMFGSTTASVWGPMVCTIVCIVLVTLIVLGGVKNGIEKANKIMLPALCVMIVIVAVRSLTLPGASGGISFLFAPNPSAVEEAGGIGVVVLRAVGACFASLSIGYGAHLTYGSYLSKKENIIKNSILIPIGDTLFALVAALATIPMCFAAGIEPTSGAGMMFGVLPQAFAAMGGSGRIFCTIFFILALFAALTSIVSLLEVGVCWMEGSLGISRLKSCLIIDAIMIVFGVLEVLSYGPLSNVLIGGYNFFDFVCTLADVYILPLCAMFIAIFVGWVWTPEKALKEITNDGTLKFPVFKIWKFLIKFVAPVGIIIVFIGSL